MHGDYKLGIMRLYRAEERVAFLVGVHYRTGERVVCREATEADLGAMYAGRVCDWTRDAVHTRAWDRLAGNGG